MPRLMPSSGFSRRCSRPIPRQPRWCCRSGRCTRCTPSRRERSSPRAAERSEPRRWRGVRVRAGRVDAVEVRGELMPVASGDRRRSLVRLAERCSETIRHRSSTAIFATAALMTPMPIVTVNLWYDRPVMTEAFAGLPGRTMQWVFDKRIAFGGSASHLSLVTSGATAIVGYTNDALADLAAREVEASLPGARGVWPIRATVDPRETGDVLARARAAAAAGHARRRSRGCSSPATGRIRGCRRRSRGRW